MEGWEEEARHKNSRDCEEMIANKYAGIRFYDPETSVTLAVYDKKKECYWQAKRRSMPEGETWGWHVLCYNPEEDPEQEGDMEPFDLEIVDENVGTCPQTEETHIICEKENGL